MLRYYGSALHDALEGSLVALWIGEGRYYVMHIVPPMAPRISMSPQLPQFLLASTSYIYRGVARS